jgi:6-phosphogluconolactonase
MQLHIFKNINELSTTVADWMIAYINDVLQTQDRFTVVLSGGSTPKKLNELLTSEKYRNKIDWGKVHVFWGDERFVPFADERNNAKMAFDTLLDHVPVVKENIHVMQTENITPEAAAKAYEQILNKYFFEDGSDKIQETNRQSQTFDLVLLGMGDDGHTLSLFPGKTSVIHEAERSCISLWLESQEMYRITLTHAVVNRAKQIAFLVSGTGKAKALHEVLQGAYNPDLYPAQIIKPVRGELHCFVDEAAAMNLER